MLTNIIGNEKDVKDCELCYYAVRPGHWIANTLNGYHRKQALLSFFVQSKCNSVHTIVSILNKCLPSARQYHLFHASRARLINKYD